MLVLMQESLLCGCGVSSVGRLGLCSKCERRARLSRENFDGFREAALRRDGYRCRVCNEPDESLLLVHHRKPGVSGLENLITLCRRCHVRIHRTFRPGFWFASIELLRRLWREVNADLAEQRLLDLLGETRAGREEQTGLFESGDGL